MKICEIMNRAIIIDEDMSIKEAAKIMSMKNIGCLTFLVGGKIMGIVTERDILKNVSDPNKKISLIMTKKVVVANLEDNIEKIVSIMTKHKIKKILIIEDEKLVGIVTSTDIISCSDLLHEDMFF